jgi:tetratricopeptide (TPR) repeat protein
MAPEAGAAGHGNDGAFSGERHAQGARRTRLPWTRGLTALAIGFPALAIGGVPSWVVPTFVGLVLALMLRHLQRSSDPLRIPSVAGVFAALAAATFLQWLPVPGIRSLLAPDLERAVTEALSATDVSSPGGLTVTAPDTALEVARLVGLTGLVVAAAQMSWRISAVAIAAVGSLVAILGLAHDIAGTEAIYGLYRPLDAIPSRALRGTFVNPNHQSGLLLLGIACGAALAHHIGRLRARTTDAAQYERQADWIVLALGAVLVQVAALVLSLSRGGLLGLAILGPVAMWIGLRRSRRGRPHRPSRRGPSLRAAVGLGLVVVVFVVARHGAWSELQTLGDLDADAAKLAMVRGGLELSKSSPALGIGRGGFIDLYAVHAPASEPILYTHLESAPAMMVVEWGPVVGGIALLGLLWWWGTTVLGTRTRSDRGARRILLAGLAALGVQQLGDFALEFLGVAAPAAALVGALSSNARRTWNRGRVRVLAVVGLVGALVLALWAHGRTWSHRTTLDRAIVDGTRDGSADLRDRPLDGRLHAALARRAFDERRLDDAIVRANVATERLPQHMDAWLVLGVVLRALERDDAAQDAIRSGLDRLRSAPDARLLQWIVGAFPEPDALARVTPSEPIAAAHLAGALLRDWPDHADAVAARFGETRPTDAFPHRIRALAALRRGQSALALHHARLLRAAAPDEAHAYTVLVDALAMLDPPRTDEIIDTLELGLRSVPASDTEGLGQLEERLVTELLARNDPADRARAADLSAGLLQRPAPNRQIRLRRERLVRRATSTPTD